MLKRERNSTPGVAPYGRRFVLALAAAVLITTFSPSGANACWCADIRSMVDVLAEGQTPIVVWTAHQDPVEVFSGLIPNVVPDRHEWTIDVTEAYGGSTLDTPIAVQSPGLVSSCAMDVLPSEPAGYVVHTMPDGLRIDACLSPISASELREAAADLGMDGTVVAPAPATPEPAFIAPAVAAEVEEPIAAPTRGIREGIAIVVGVVLIVGAWLVRRWRSGQQEGESE